MVEWVARVAQVLIALGVAYVAAMWFVLVVWTFRDIEARSRSVLTQVFSTLLSVLFFIPGVLLYLILRPKQTLDEAFQRSLEEEHLLQDLEELPLCPACHRYVDDDFVLCPHCHAHLREPCPDCERLVDLRWAVCPYCAAVQQGRGDATERVEPLAARWTAPALRRRRAAPGTESARRVVPLTTQSADRGVTNGHRAPADVEDGSVAKPPSAEIPTLLRNLVRPLDRLGLRGTRRSPVDPPTEPVADDHSELPPRDYTEYWELDVSGDGAGHNGHAQNSHHRNGSYDSFDSEADFERSRPRRFASAAEVAAESDAAKVGNRGADAE